MTYVAAGIAVSIVLAILVSRWITRQRNEQERQQAIAEEIRKKRTVGDLVRGKYE